MTVWKPPTLRDVLQELVLKCVTVKGHEKVDGVSVPVVGCDGAMLDEWLEEHPDALRLGDEC